MWFQMDGSPPHFEIGQGGPVAWSPRSPDHNLINFYLWRYMKTLVYAFQIQQMQEKDLERIQQAAEQQL